MCWCYISCILHIVFTRISLFRKKTKTRHFVCLSVDGVSRGKASNRVWLYSAWLRRLFFLILKNYTLGYTCLKYANKVNETKNKSCWGWSSLTSAFPPLILRGNWREVSLVSREFYKKKKKMSGRAVFSLPSREPLNPRFGEVSLDILTDILSNLNKRNKLHLESVSDLCGCVKDSRLVGECCGP